MGLVLVVDSDEAFAAKVEAVTSRELHQAEAKVANSIAEALDIADAAKPYVVVFGPGMAGASVMSAAGKLSAVRPAPAVVYVSHEISNELLRGALQAGLRDVLPADESTFGDVAQAVAHAYTAAASARLQPAQAAPEPEITSLAEVITIFSTKGGVGKTVIASNLAVALAKRAPGRTVLVDLDLQFGDAAVMMNLEPRRTIADAAQAHDRLDAQMLSGFITKHEASGLEVLLAPIRPEDSELVTTARIGRIIGLLRQMYDYVVIDTPGALDDSVLATLDRSDHVLAVAMMDIASVKNMRIALQKLQQLGYDQERVELILNRADSKVLLDAPEVEKAIGKKIVARIPSDRLVPRSVNKGVPIVLDAPKSGVSRSICELADSLAGRVKEGAHVA